MTLIPRLLLALLLLVAPAVAAESLLKPHDVIALVGGQDMVTLAEGGYLELPLTCARPEYELKFRSLAWEGDTVFEQRRDLNYPSLEHQLEDYKVTVVVVQFGRMESLAGSEKLPEFIEAYEKLIERLKGAGDRRVIVMAPFRDEHVDIRRSEESSDAWGMRRKAVTDYSNALFSMAEKKGIQILAPTIRPGSRDLSPLREPRLWNLSLGLASQLDPKVLETRRTLQQTGDEDSFNVDSIPPQATSLLKLIRTKNWLWFNYYRPQNWAFLAGDRTNQPSSRDHIDRNKRWFPEEMEQYLPLIAAKEKEIDALAAQLAKPAPKP